MDPHTCGRYATELSPQNAVGHWFMMVGGGVDVSLQAALAMPRPARSSSRCAQFRSSSCDARAMAVVAAADPLAGRPCISTCRSTETSGSCTPIFTNSHESAVMPKVRLSRRAVASHQLRGVIGAHSSVGCDRRALSTAAASAARLERLQLWLSSVRMLATSDTSGTSAPSPCGCSSVVPLKGTRTS